MFDARPRGYHVVTKLLPRTRELFAFTWNSVVPIGESAQLAPSSSFYVVTSAILGCKSFKIGGNFWIILLKSCKSKDLTSFLD